MVAAQGPAPGAPPPSRGSSEALNAEMLRWEVLWTDLQIERPIGQGSFGCVYLGRWSQTQVWWC